MFAKHLLCLSLVLSVMGFFPLSIESDECNEFVCGSVVSKCLLTQSCQCKLTDCFCCKDCLNCLGELYIECCSCLEMCPKHNQTLSALAPKSQIGDFDGVPELFDTLTAEDDDDQWTIVRFPMHNGLQHHYNTAGSDNFGFSLPAADAIDEQASAHKQVSNSANCTVVYLKFCKTNNKCLQFCESMGSNSYRWFHDGCCECVGANCYNYGINESRCTACPNEDEESNGETLDGNGDYDDDNEDDVNWNYGEDEMNYN